MESLSLGGPCITLSLIVKGWADQKMIREIMLFLHQHGISTSRAVRIYKTFGNDAHQGPNARQKIIKNLDCKVK